MRLIQEKLGLFYMLALSNVVCNILGQLESLKRFIGLARKRGITETQPKRNKCIALHLLDTIYAGFLAISHMWKKVILEICFMWEVRGIYWSKIIPRFLILPAAPLIVHPLQLRKERDRLKQGKAAGSDGISPRLLKSCSTQLCEILDHLFNLSLQLQRIPTLWKTSSLVPVPKKKHPTGPEDYRPIALISHIMKTFEKLL